MVLDPYEVLGIARDATLQEAKAAYRRLAMLFHPDRLAGLKPAVRAEGERRMREATEALRAISANFGRPLHARGHEPEPERVQQPTADVDVYVPQEPNAHVYDAELRSVEGPRLHVRWGGRHAAAVLAVLKREHRIEDGLVRQIEWGAYEVVLPGSDMRRLLEWAIPGGCRYEAAELVAADTPIRSRLMPPGDPAPEPEIHLDRIAEALDDETNYSLMTDVY